VFPRMGAFAASDVGNSMYGRPIEGIHLGKNKSKRFRCCGAEVGEDKSIGVKGVELWKGVRPGQSSP
jgi:hypothetical protein